MSSAFIVKEEGTQGNYARILRVTLNREAAMDFYLLKVLNISREGFEEKVKKILFKANNISYYNYSVNVRAVYSYEELQRMEARKRVLRDWDDYNLTEVPFDESSDVETTPLLNQIFRFGLSQSRPDDRVSVEGTFTFWTNNGAVYTCPLLKRLNELWIKYQNHGMNLIEIEPR